ELAVPADDEPRFWTEFYPALRQVVEIHSSDGSVVPPEVQPPRLALRVAFLPEHRTRLDWSFRYRVGDGAVDVPLAAPHPDQHSAQHSGVVRDAAEEERLLADLDVL